MNFLIFSTFLSIVTASQVKHQEVNNVVDDLTPPDVKKSIEDFGGLVAKGEHSRSVAIANQTRRQLIYDDAFAAWKKSHEDLETALGNQKEAEDKEKIALEKRDAAIKFRDQKIKEKNHADSLVPPAKKWMEDEIARVAEEDEALQKVKKILEKLIAEAPTAELSTSTSRSLLGLARRTVTLMTAPSFIASLTNADPKRVQEVLDIVLNLIKEGQEAEQDATDKYNARVHEAKVAADNLAEARHQLSLREQEYADAIAFRKQKVSEAEAAAAHEDEMREIRDEMKTLLEIQIDFTNREIARIDHEKAILDEAIRLQNQLHKVTQLLA